MDCRDPWRSSEEAADVVAVGFIEEAAPGVGVKAADAFAELRMLVQALGRERGDAEEDEGGVVEGLPGGDHEVRFGAGWFGDGTGRDSTVVRHEAEDALGLLAGEGDLIAVGGHLVGIDRRPWRCVLHRNGRAGALRAAKCQQYLCGRGRRFGERSDGLLRHTE
jgi:hypothetical protein